jgi:hypothetical protein
MAAVIATVSCEPDVEGDAGRDGYREPARRAVLSSAEGEPLLVSDSRRPSTRSRFATRLRP